jgi:dihydrolipoamide dehydrogenase
MTIYDAIVIGAGPGGYNAAARLAQHGKKTLLIEKAQLGGLCLNAGCIPTKTLLQSAKLFAQMQNAEVYGIQLDQTPHINLAAVQARKERLIESLRDGVEKMLTRFDVEIVQGSAEFVDRRTVRVTGEQYQAPHFLIATGATPPKLNLPGADQAHVMTTTQLLHAETLPESLAIIGNHPIALGFASIFSLLGVPVSVITDAPDVLPLLDNDIVSLLKQEMGGVQFHTNTTPRTITANSIICSKGGQTLEILASTVLYVAERLPNSANLGLDNIGIDFDSRGFIRVNDTMQTNIPGIYAIGDVTGVSMWAHSAARMADVAVNHILGQPDKLRVEMIPTVVYTYPEVAYVGLTEQQARQQRREVKIARLPMNANGRFVTDYEGRRGLCKVVIDAKTNTLLGIHLIGANCGDMIAGAAAMLEDEFRVSDIQQLVFPHPTVSEILRDAVMSY